MGIKDHYRTVKVAFCRPVRPYALKVELLPTIIYDISYIR